jgi:hypothetical protein
MPDGSPTLALTTWLDRMETTLDKPVTPAVAIPAKRPTGSPVAPSPVTPPKRTATTRKRPAKLVGSPTAHATDRPTARRTESRELTRLRIELNDLIERDEDLIEQCGESVDLVAELKAELKAIPPRLRKDVKVRLAVANEEYTRLGGLAEELDARLDAVRDEIERLECE